MNNYTLNYPTAHGPEGPYITWTVDDDGWTRCRIHKSILDALISLPVSSGDEDIPTARIEGPAGEVDTGELEQWLTDKRRMEGYTVESVYTILIQTPDNGDWVTTAQAVTDEAQARSIANNLEEVFPGRVRIGRSWRYS